MSTKILNHHVVFDRETLKLYAGGEWPLAVMHVRERETQGPAHTHVFCELVIVAGGSGVYQGEDADYQIHAGDIFLLTPGIPHDFPVQNHLEIYNVLWVPDELGFDFRDLQDAPGFMAFFHLEPQTRGHYRFGSHLRLSPPQLAAVLEIVRKMEAEFQRRQSGFYLCAVSLLGELFTAICRFYADQTGEEHLELLRLEKVMTYINEHFSETIKRGTLARLAGMSEPTFYRRFKGATGQSPSEYIIELRLKKAEELLRSTRFSLPEIAAECGFTDSNYFGLQFKKHFKLTPHRYRLNYARGG